MSYQRLLFVIVVVLACARPASAERKWVVGGGVVGAVNFSDSGGLYGGRAVADLRLGASPFYWANTVDLLGQSSYAGDLGGAALLMPFSGIAARFFVGRRRLVAPHFGVQIGAPTISVGGHDANVYFTPFIRGEGGVDLHVTESVSLRFVADVNAAVDSSFTFGLLSVAILWDPLVR